jgi:hypothetical protein
MVAYEAAQQGETLAASRSVASNRCVDAARPSFPDPTESVDQEVVCEIGPTFLCSRVEPVEGPQGGRYLLGPVVVRRGGVMHQ